MWFWWALGSALVSGMSVTFNKKVLNKGVHSSVVAFVIFALVTVSSLPLFYVSGNVKVDTTFFLASITSAIVFSMSKNITLRIFKQNNLSDIAPLGSIAPVTLYILSVIFLNEIVKITAVFGIILIALGVYILNYDRSDKNFFHPIVNFFRNRSSVLFFAAIILSNISAITEKTAINHTLNQSIAPLAFWENFFLTVITGAYVIKTNKGWVKEVRENFGNLFVAGFLYSGLYLMVMLGFKEGPISLVSSIKKLEVLFVLIFSYIFFKERPTKKIYIATFIMLLAVYLIKI